MRIRNLVYIISVLSTACSPSKNATLTTAGATDVPTVLATTNVVADLVRRLTPIEYPVVTLMEAGVDPHLYKAKPSDLEKLQRAKVLFFSGHKLEGKLDETLRALRSQRPNEVVELTEKLPTERLLNADKTSKEIDPHIWFDVELWSQTVVVAEEALCRAFAAACPGIRERAAVYRAELAELHAWVRNEVKRLPRSRRVLVTSHDAFRYFGRAYDFDVVGLQGISTASEASLSDLRSVIQLVKKRKVPAVFVETSVSPKSLQRLSADAGVRIGGELFSDTLGNHGDLKLGFATGTYDGMIRYNVRAILDALLEPKP